jgi:DUF4097 and DUF4098 domain-containing protein YvlB
MGLALAIFLLCTPWLSAQNGAEGSFARTLKVSGPVDLQVRTGAGRISVREGGATEVQINAVIRGREDLFGSGDIAQRVHAIEANPPIEQNGNTIRIGMVDNSDLYRDISISYEILTPAQTRLTSRTGSGTQSVEGIQGPVDAHSGSGSLNIMDVNGEVNADTGSGGIDIDGVRNSVRARTGSGSIRASHVGQLAAISGNAQGDRSNTSAQLDLQTGSGTIRLQDGLGSLRAHTGSGSIQAAGEPEGSWRLDTGSGGVTVELPHNAGFNLMARTGSGSIRVDHPLTSQGEMSKHTVRGTVRGGGPDLEIRTGSGGIRVQ